MTSLWNVYIKEGKGKQDRARDLRKYFRTDLRETRTRTFSAPGAGGHQPAWDPVNPGNRRMTVRITLSICYYSKRYLMSAY